MGSSSISGQKVLVAGGSRGIGLHLARVLIEGGAHVALCGRDEASLQTATDDLGKRKGNDQRLDVRQCDLADPGQLENWAGRAIDALGGIDTLICTATGQAVGNSEAEWKKSYDIDLMAPVRLIDTTLSSLGESACASVLLVASRTALEPAPVYTAYATLKAAVVHLTTSKAASLASSRIRVNCIAPGSTEYEGGLWERLKSQQPDAYQATLKNMPFGRLATPADIVPAMVFLISPAAGWITGQTLLVDGGQILPG